MRVARDLHSLLHPADDRDIPVPGFPSGEALTAWAQTRPRDGVVNALLDVLRNDSQPQQYAAMGALRGLGVAITGEHVGDSVCWRVEHPTTSEQITIERDASPDRQTEGDNLNPKGTELDGLRDVIRDVIAEVIRQEVYTEDMDSGDSRVAGTTEAANRVMEVLEQRRLLEALHWAGDR